MIFHCNKGAGTRGFLRAAAVMFIFLLLFCTEACARNIRVILSGAKKYQISSSSAVTLTDAKKKTAKAGKSFTVVVSGNHATVGGKKYSLPVTFKSGAPFGFNGRKYRGTMRVAKGGGLINVLDIEDYLRGVLKAEANPTWPMEYLKAQAIVSRTFALRESIVSQKRDYDVTDNTSSQVYRGMSAETARTDKAVKQTKNKALAYGSELAFTPFHSDSGGATANNADVWGKNLSYLRSVKEPVSYKSPNSSWTARITPAQAAAALNKLKKPVGTVKEIRIANTDKFGRAVSLTFRGSSGSTTVKASSFRTAVGSNLMKSTFLKSTRAAASSAAKTPQPSKQSVKPSGPLSAKEESLMSQFIADNAFTGQEMMDLLMNPDKRREYLNKALGRDNSGSDKPSTPPAVSDVPIKSGQALPYSGGAFVFSGSGWGHGVGLSQYGAKAMADKGWSAEKILTYYFSGTKVKTVKSK